MSGKLSEVQGRTYEEMKGLLDKHNLCNVVRPTGFGKTKLIADYCHENGDKLFLYIYDTHTNRDNFLAKYETLNVQFVSYAFLSRFDDEAREEFINELLDDNYYCVIFDESHLIGGTKVELVFNDLKSTGKIKLLGASANGYRMDSKDIGIEYFKMHEVFQYNMIDAIVDDIVVPPLYTVCAKSEDAYEEYKSMMTDSEAKLIEECGNKGEILLSALNKQYASKLPEYMRFICFLNSIEEVDEVGESNLVKQIAKSLPGYNINIIKVTSSYEHRDGIYELSNLEQTPNTIDLICSCNMLNQGLHLDVLTGLLFCRKTDSDIIFTQQFGRAVSVMQSEPIIIVDYVSNYNNMRVLGDALILREQGKYTDRVKVDGNSSIIDYCEITMSAKQLEFLKLMERFEHIRTLDKLVGLGAIIRAYRDFGSTIEGIVNSGVCGLGVKDLAQIFNRKGVLRAEDAEYLG